MLSMEINRHAPDDWGLSAGWAAWLIRADRVQTSYQLIERNNPGTVAAPNEDIRHGTLYGDARHKYEAEASRIGNVEHGILDVRAQNLTNEPPLDQ
jgi:hypothetical protein